MGEEKKKRKKNPRRVLRIDIIPYTYAHTSTIKSKKGKEKEKKKNRKVNENQGHTIDDLSSFFFERLVPLFSS